MSAFREQAMIAILGMRSRDASEYAQCAALAQKFAEAACGQWGHDDRRFDDRTCKRCGVSLLSSPRANR